jgi:hypothetical protein
MRSVRLIYRGTEASRGVQAWVLRLSPQEAGKQGFWGKKPMSLMILLKELFMEFIMLYPGRGWMKVPALSARK